MNDKELLQLWNNYDPKLDQVLKLNQDLTIELTKNKLQRAIGRMIWPKRLIFLLGLPYTLILIIVTRITFESEAYVMSLSFGVISLIMLITLASYIYHLFLISAINIDDSVRDVQQRLSQLRLSSFTLTRMTVFQLPFWSLCWFSINAFKTSPFWYGGINIIIFLGLSFIAWWIYRSLGNKESKISKIVFTGIEWEPIVKSSDILEQLKVLED